MVLNNADTLTARRLGLHPWRQIAEQYGGDRPSRLKRSIVDAGPDERTRWMNEQLGLGASVSPGKMVSDYSGRAIMLNERVVTHISPHPERVPYVQWIDAAVKRPLEVWRRFRDGAFGLEPRLYYLFAAARPEVHSIVAIVGERDLVAFNMIPIRPRNAPRFRGGELVYVGYDAPCGRCPHGCCESHEHK
jgi:hypothetical protein